jgi:hypothetical protein
LSRPPDITAVRLTYYRQGPKAPVLRAPVGLPPIASESMAQSLYFREQAGRCRRLARDCTDEHARDGLFKLANEYSARAAALDHAAQQVPEPGSHDQDS